MTNRLLACLLLQTLLRKRIFLSEGRETFQYWGNIWHCQYCHYLKTSCREKTFFGDLNKCVKWIIKRKVKVYLLKKWQSDTPSMTRRKIRRKKKAPEARYTMAVVKLMETLLRSAIVVKNLPSSLSSAQLYLLRILWSVACAPFMGKSHYIFSVVERAATENTIISFQIISQLTCFWCFKCTLYRGPSFLWPFQF